MISSMMMQVKMLVENNDTADKPMSKLPAFELIYSSLEYHVASKTFLEIMSQANDEFCRYVGRCLHKMTREGGDQSTKCRGVDLMRKSSRLDNVPWASSWVYTLWRLIYLAQEFRPPSKPAGKKAPKGMPLGQLQHRKHIGLSV